MFPCIEDPFVLERTSAIVRRIRALRRDRKLRDAERLLLAEGARLAEEAIAARAPIELALVSPRLVSRPDGRALRRELARVAAEIVEAPDALLDSLQDARSPQPVLLVIRRSETDLDAVVRGRLSPTLLVVAHGIQDPGNLGSMIRTADAAGASGFVATGESADLYHPRTVRATMGSIFRLPAIHADVSSVVERLRRTGVGVVGTRTSGGSPYDRVDWQRPVAILLGPESRGLPEDLLAEAEVAVTIPVHAGVQSLSVGAAGAVLLFEAARSRRSPSVE